MTRSSAVSQREHRDFLMVACAFAKTFLQYADAELNGATPDPRIEAQKQLEAALLDISYYESEDVF